MRTESELRQLAGKILAETDSTDAEVAFNGNFQIATRFGGSAITQNTCQENERIYLTVAYGNRRGAAQGDRTDDESIRRLVAKAQDIARQSPEDPEFVGTLPPQKYSETPARFHQSAAARDPLKMAEEVREMISIVEKHSSQASGLSTTTLGVEALANKKGLFAFDRFSLMEISLTANGANGSGSAEISRENPAMLDYVKTAKSAAETAAAAQSPREIPPGDYTVIFEPRATWNFLMPILFNISARTADEGASPFSGKVGKKIFSEKVNIGVNIDDPELPPSRYGDSGLPARRCEWIREGVLAKLHYDRYWAKVKEREPDAPIFPLCMSGEDNSVADLVAGCKRGLLVKNIWYIRYVDQKELLLTGMTRDGLFLIENGKISHPVKNFRFNESPFVFLKNIVGLGPAVRVGSSAKVPAVMSENFTFSSGTESV